MDLRTKICFEISRRLIQQPAAKRTLDYSEYQNWRHESLSVSWSRFSDDDINGKKVLDFGCGDGHLSLFLAKSRRPRVIAGVDINGEAVDRALDALARADVLDRVNLEFRQGIADHIPFPNNFFDTVLAFDCVEHVMAPAEIFHEWNRVLLPGGRCLIEWYPYKGPWGPHMESLIPIPWAHVVFGERAMMRSAEAIYDLPCFVPRHWDLDESGRKKPNKWRAWSSFGEQGYINKLDIATFRRLAEEAGFAIDRMDQRSFSGSIVRRGVSRTLMALPFIGEYFVSFVLVELRKVRRAAAHDTFKGPVT
jgi:SAM-dependent methyltransferase